MSTVAEPLKKPPASYSPVIRLGWPVLYLPRGVRENARPATVLKVESNGMVELNVQERGHVMFVGSTRHIGDPYWNDNPHLLNKSGAWDYIHGLSLEPLHEKAALSFTVDPEKEKQIRQLAAAGKTPSDIAKIIATAGYNTALITSILEHSV